MFDASTSKNAHPDHIMQEARDMRNVLAPPRFGIDGVVAQPRSACNVEKNGKKQMVTSFLYLNGGQSRNARVDAKSFSCPKIQSVFTSSQRLKDVCLLSFVYPAHTQAMKQQGGK